MARTGGMSLRLRMTTLPTRKHRSMTRTGAGLTVLTLSVLLFCGCSRNPLADNGEDINAVHDRSFARLGPILAYPGSTLHYPTTLDAERFNDGKTYALNTTDSPVTVEAYYTSHLGPSSADCLGGVVPCSGYRTTASDGSTVYIDVSTVNVPGLQNNGTTEIEFHYYPATTAGSSAGNAMPGQATYPNQSRGESSGTPGNTSSTRDLLGNAP